MGVDWFDGGLFPSPLPGVGEPAYRDLQDA